MKEDKYPIERFVRRSTEEVEAWEDGYDYEEKRIIKIIKDMPDCFPAFESDEFDNGWTDCKKFLLNSLK